VYRFLETLEYEDREVFCQVMIAAAPLLTEMQARCLILWMCDLAQDQIGRAYGFSQQTAGHHIAKGLEVIAHVAESFV